MWHSNVLLSLGRLCFLVLVLLICLVVAEYLFANTEYHLMEPPFSLFLTSKPSRNLSHILSLIEFFYILPLTHAHTCLSLPTPSTHPSLPPPHTHTHTHCVSHLVEVQKAVKEIRESNKNTNKTHKNLEAKLKKGKLLMW